VTEKIKTITQYWRNWESLDFLRIDFQKGKASITIDQKGPAFILSYKCIFIHISIYWNLNRSRIFGYNKKEINHFISLSLTLFGTRNLPPHMLGTGDTFFHQWRYQYGRFCLVISLKSIIISHQFRQPFFHLPVLGADSA